jgi:hypothetical protein
MVTFINKYDFQVRYTKGKHNKVADALRKSMQGIHLETINTYEFDLESRLQDKRSLGKG